MQFIQKKLCKKIKYLHLLLIYLQLVVKVKEL